MQRVVLHCLYPSKMKNLHRHHIYAHLNRFLVLKENSGELSKKAIQGYLSIFNLSINTDAITLTGIE